MEPGHFENAPASIGFRAVTGDAAGDDSDQYRSYFRPLRTLRSYGNADSQNW
jgi:hypothetical protein